MERVHKINPPTPEEVQRDALFRALTRVIHAQKGAIRELALISGPLADIAERISDDMCRRVWAIEDELKALGYTADQIEIGVLERRVFELERLR